MPDRLLAEVVYMGSGNDGLGRIEQDPIGEDIMASKGASMRARLFVLAAGFIFTTYLCGIGKLLAQDATYEFKGNSLGMTLEEFKRQHFSGYVYYDKKGNLTKEGKKNAIQTATPVCTDSPALLSQPYMRANLGSDEVACPEDHPQFAGQRLAEVSYRFYKGRLFQIQIQFNSSGYSNVKEAFIAKYGPVTETEYKDYQNGFGAHWQGELSTWRRGTQMIEVMEGPDTGPGQEGCDFRSPSTGDCLVPKLDASAILRDNSLMPSTTPSAKPDF